MIITRQDIAMLKRFHEVKKIEYKYHKEQFCSSLTDHCWFQVGEEINKGNQYDEPFIYAIKKAERYFINKGKRLNKRLEELGCNKCYSFEYCEGAAIYMCKDFYLCNIWNDCIEFKPTKE